MVTAKELQMTKRLCEILDTEIYDEYIKRTNSLSSQLREILKGHELDMIQLGEFENLLRRLLTSVESVNQNYSKVCAMVEARDQVIEGLQADIDIFRNRVLNPLKIVDTADDF
jgi:hypothetical protein